MRKIPILLIGLLLLSSRVSNAQIVITPSTYVSSSGQTVGPITIPVNGITTTQTSGLDLINNTLSTAGVPVQQPPCIYFDGHVWNTTSVAADNTSEVTICVVPTSGTTPSWTMKFGSSLNGSAATFPMTLTNSGILTIAGSLTSAGVGVFGNSGYVHFNGQSFINSIGDGQVDITNNGATAGVGFDVTTNAVLKLRTTAFTGYASVDALAYDLSGSFFASTTAPTVSAGFGSGVAGTVTKNTGTLVVQVTVGTNAGGTTGTLTFPSAPTGWICNLQDTANTADLTRQTGYTQTTAAFSTTVAWTTGDTLVGLCGPF